MNLEKDLASLGIGRTYDLEEDQLKYRVDSDMLGNSKSPRDYYNHIKSVVDRIAKDAEKSKGLENVTIAVYGDNSKKFIAGTRKLVGKAENQGRILRDKEFVSERVNKVLNCSTILFGGVGAVAGYIAGCPVAVYVAEHINNASKYLAPIAGLAEVITSLGLAAVGALGGVLLSAAFVTAPVIAGSIKVKCPLATKAEIYEKILRSMKEEDENEMFS